ncbi:collagen-like protein [Endozoicomonas ascidiicola]|uniref:collagen-like protein n=1 Tax=Endozoicomonas ascidiicola TaxID=1698521 RepID=UPI00082D0B5C|nr:collagen-like protein [Endozoicomonas ascidiicola]
MTIGVQHSGLPVSASINFNSSGNELRNRKHTEGVLHKGRLVEVSEASLDKQMPRSTHENNNQPHLPSSTHTRPSERLTAHEQTVGERLFDIFSDGDLRSTFTTMNLLREELGHGPVFSLEAIDKAIDGLKQISDSYSNQSNEPVSQSKRQNLQRPYGDTVDRFLSSVNAFQDGESRQLLKDFFSSPGLIARLASYEDYWAENLDGREMTVNKFFDHLEDIPPVSEGTKKGVSGAGGGNYSISSLGAAVLLLLSRFVGASAQESDGGNRTCSKPKGDIDPCLVGERGEKGESGLKGEKGRRGNTGTIGAWGPKGVKGDQGPEGPRGYRHPVSAFKGEIEQALTAMNITGPQGEKGNMGQKGEEGVSIEHIPYVLSEVGQKGNKGSRGQRGFQGQRGHPGVKGDQGMQGLVGMTGAPGSKGEPGAPGERALQKNAIKGSKGEKGMQGGIGAKGTAGAKGDKGISGLDGASGQAGPKGEQGLNGSPGFPGVAGSPGLKGDSGAIGARGDKGNKGEPGAIGLSGSMGKNGTDGTKGDTGSSGPKGIKGEVGAPGLVGPPGLMGQPGPAWSPQNITDAQGLPDSATSCECGDLSVIEKIGVAGGVIFLIGGAAVGLYKAAKYCCGSSGKPTDDAAGKKTLSVVKPQALRQPPASSVVEAGESIPLTQGASAAASV